MSTAKLVANNLIFGLPLAAIESTQNLIYTAVGVAASIVSAITCSKFKKCNSWATYTEHSSQILAPLHRQVIKVLRPNDWMKGHCYSYEENGIISNKVLFSFTVDYLLRCGNSENTYVREIGTRLCFAVKAVAAVVTKVFDITLGVLAGGLSIIPLFARSDAINQFAHEQLQATDLANTFCRCLRGITNPRAIYPSLAFRH